MLYPEYIKYIHRLYEEPDCDELIHIALKKIAAIWTHEINKQLNKLNP